MHIVLIGYLHNNGGIQTHSHWLATGLVERGHSVEILTPAPLRDSGPGLPQNRSYVIHEYRTFADIRRLSVMPRPVPDCVIVTGTGWKAMLLGRSIKSARRRVFFEVMSGERNSRIDPRDLVHFGYDAIVGQGSGVARAFIEHFNWSKPHVVIPALPEPLEVVCDIPPSKGREFGSGSKLKLAYFSRLVPYKGAGWLIKSWDRLSKTADSLDIWGTGPAHDQFAELIDQAGLGHAIALKGRYPNGQDYVDLLQQYDLTLLPTWGREGAPLVLLESMACGVPFVANGVGGIPDYSNPQSAVTSGKLDEFLPLYDELSARMIRGEVDRATLQQHYNRHFAFKALIDRWEAFLSEPLQDANGVTRR